MPARAGAAARTIPVVAAATAAAVRAFFGEATVRAIRETNTENLFFGGMAVAGGPLPRLVAACVAGLRRRRDPGGLGRLATAPQKQARGPSAMTPFASGGRIRDVGGPDVIWLSNAQVRGCFCVGMTQVSAY